MKTSYLKKKLIVTYNFKKDLKKLPVNVVNLTYEAALKLCIDPYNEELDIKKLTGFKNIYRVVIKKDYRLIYTFDEQKIFLLQISHRKDIYRSLEF